MVETLGDEIEFLIVTRDRDCGSSQPYTGVKVDLWNNVGKAQVFYASPTMFSWCGFRKIVTSRPHDLVYLNSFFSPRSTGVLLLLRHLGRTELKPIVIAPRGEFSPGGLQIKFTKKWIYIAIVKLLRLYRGMIWQASSEYEAQDIRRMMPGVASNIIVAPDLLSTSPFRVEDKRPRATGVMRDNRLRLVFVSRISPKKNLVYLLEILQKVKANINLSIFGPLEDLRYWEECKKLIHKLPSNTSVQYRGELSPNEVPNVFAEHDVFAFPTRGENFGHVIFESLAAGTCVVLSDQTMWKKDESGSVEVIPLEDPDDWAVAIDRWALRSEKELAVLRDAAIAYAREYIASNPAVNQNRALFQHAVNGRAC